VVVAVAVAVAGEEGPWAGGGRGAVSIALRSGTTMAAVHRKAHTWHLTDLAHTKVASTADFIEILSK